MKKLLRIVLLIGFSLGMITHAQTPFTVADDELLVYVQWREGKQVYVAQQGASRHTYTLADDECASISPDGRYIAISQEQPSTLKIIDFSIQQVVFETLWSSAWTRPCVMGWQEKDVLYVVTQNGEYENFIYLYFKFENATLSPIPTPQRIYPDLPYFTPIFETGGDRNITTFYLQNPAYPDIYIYDACFIESLYMYEECPFWGMTIYDLSTDTILERTDIRPTNYIDFYVGVVRYDDSIYGIIDWSPNGRYLAFFDGDISWNNRPPDRGQILIYDLQEDRYIEDPDNLSPYHTYHDILWSDTNTLLVWQTGYLLAESSNYNDSLARFIFYNPDTQTGVSSINIFNVMWYRAIFSPDSSGLLIIGKLVVEYDKPPFDENPTRADLIRISTTTGEHTILDTDVTQIVTWRKLDADETWGD